MRPRTWKTVAVSLGLSSGLGLWGDELGLGFGRLIPVPLPSQTAALAQEPIATPASPSPWPAPYVALKAAKEQGMLAAVLCASQSHPESQRLRTALLWTSEEAKRLGVQFTELTAESHADQLRALNVKVYPTLIVYRRSADGERLELADALKGVSDPVAVFQWLKRTAQTQNRSVHQDPGLRQTGVGPNTLVPAASRGAANSEHRASPVIASQPSSEPTAPTLIKMPDDSGSVPSAPAPAPVSVGTSPLRLEPEIIADAGQPQPPNPDPEPPQPSLTPPPPAEAEAPPPPNPEPEPEPEPNPDPDPRAAPQPAPAPAPNASTQPQPPYGLGIDDPRYRTPPHLVGRSDPHAQSFAAPAPHPHPSTTVVAPSPQSPAPKSPPWLISAFGHKHSAAVSAPHQGRVPARAEPIAVPALPSSPMPEPPQAPAPSASPQSSVVYRQAPCPPAAPLPPAPTCEIPRCLIVQVPAVYCPPAGSPQSAGAGAPAQLFLAAPMAGAAHVAKPLVFASPQSAHSQAAGKKCAFWPMEFCHQLKRKLFHHGQAHP